MFRTLAPLRRFAAFALPPRCPGCGAVVGNDHEFCAGCWGALRFLGPPWCAVCNVPFAYDRGEDALCDACAARRPRHAGVRAAVAYGPVARTLALRLKHGGRTALAEAAGRRVARLVPPGLTLLVPVPLHRGRLWSRGYNQSALIARAVGRLAGVPVDVDLLERRRATPMLRGLGKRQRARAVAAAFGVAPRRAMRLRGAAIGLVDDVYTSGATAEACIATLLDAGAASVTVLVWARVLDGDD